LAKALALRAQGIDNAQFVEDGRVKLPRQRVDVLGQGHQLRAHAACRGLDISRTSGQLLERSRLDRKYGQPLREVVVQLPRYPTVLLLLRMDEPSPQLGERLFHLLSFGHLAHETRVGQVKLVRPIADPFLQLGCIDTNDCIHDARSD
jgi:hypothetical protein